MQYSFGLLALATYVAAHGVITEVQGANGVKMPGLSGRLAYSLHPKNVLTFLSR